MKDGLHPNFRQVIFKDITTDFEYLTHSTMQTKETAKYKDGKEYPIVKFEVSSASHPFYTGKHRVMDTEGRAEKFKKKYGTKKLSSAERAKNFFKVATPRIKKAPARSLFNFGKMWLPSECGHKTNGTYQKTNILVFAVQRSDQRVLSGAALPHHP